MASPVRRPSNRCRRPARKLKEHFGRVDPEWGQVNRMRRGTLDVGIDGGPDIFQESMATRSRTAR